MTAAPDDRVVDAALHLLVYLLNEGNKDVQSNFLEYVKESATEAFFEQVKDRFHTSMANIKEARLLRTMKNNQKKQDEALSSTARESRKRSSVHRASLHENEEEYDFAPATVKKGERQQSIMLERSMRLRSQILSLVSPFHNCLS